LVLPKTQKRTAIFRFPLGFIKPGLSGDLLLLLLVVHIRWIKKRQIGMVNSVKCNTLLFFFFVSLVCAACGTEANMNARYFFAGCVLIFLLARFEWQN